MEELQEHNFSHTGSTRMLTRILTVMQDYGAPIKQCDLKRVLGIGKRFGDSMLWLINHGHVRKTIGGPTSNAQTYYELIAYKIGEEKEKQ